MLLDSQVRLSDNDRRFFMLYREFSFFSDKKLGCIDTTQIPMIYIYFFSGVLFALKVLTTFESGERRQMVHGFLVPTKWAVWVELLIIHILVPRASFMGHLSGKIFFTNFIFNYSSE